MASKHDISDVKKILTELRKTMFDLQLRVEVKYMYYNTEESLNDSYRHKLHALTIYMYVSLFVGFRGPSCSPGRGRGCTFEFETQRA